MTIGIFERKVRVVGTFGTVREGATAHHDRTTTMTTMMKLDTGNLYCTVLFLARVCLFVCLFACCLCTTFVGG